MASVLRLTSLVAALALSGAPEALAAWASVDADGCAGEAQDARGHCNPLCSTCTCCPRPPALIPEPSPQPVVNFGVPIAPVAWTPHIELRQADIFQPPRR